METTENLPKWTRVRDGYYSFRDPRNRTEWGLGRDRDAAIKAARKAAKVVEGSRPRLSDKIEHQGLPSISKERYAEIRGRAYSAMKSRAARYRRIAMTPDEFAVMWDRAGGKCELTGIPFSDEKVPGASRKPWMPSVDRIDNSLGYNFGNCRLVCISVNVAMSHFGEKALNRIARGLLYKASRMGE